MIWLLQPGSTGGVEMTQWPVGLCNLAEEEWRGTKPQMIS
jgi:hypothetical protein